VIPHGVLCFFPSYAMMEKLYTRWKATGLWGQLSAIKSIHLEPKGSGDHFDEVMTNYYKAVKRSTNSSSSSSSSYSSYSTSRPGKCTNGKRPKTESRTGVGVGGGLLMAVCRGKVSEGLDFKDDNARAVIIIGIPFPSMYVERIVIR
jgi:Fanconi anemia group J protein